MVEHLTKPSLPNKQHQYINGHSLMKMSYHGSNNELQAQSVFYNVPPFLWHVDVRVRRHTLGMCGDTPKILGNVMGGGRSLGSLA